MTLIGMLHHRKDPSTVMKSYAYAIVAKAEGADFVYFSPGCVDIKNNTINGYIYENGSWQKRITPYPDVIYNTGSPEKLKKQQQIINSLQEKIPFTTYSIGNKWSVNKRIKRGADFAQYLIPTIILTNWEELYQYIKAFQEIIVKPIDGRKGQSIYYIRSFADGFIVKQGTTDTSYTQEELIQFLNTLLKENTFIVQPYISSRTKSGLVFDFRLHVQKNGTGEWVITTIYPRIAPPGSIITNINNGGYTNYLEPFLNQEFGQIEAINIKNTLEHFTLSLASHLDELQIREYKEVIDEIGIDVGLDEDYKIWIYEVNWRPGCPPTFYLEMDVVKNTIQYAMYIANNQREINEHIQLVATKVSEKREKPIIAVTGSAGKTTTKSFISSILKTRMIIFESKEYWNTTEHTKIHKEQIKASHQAVVLEYGMAYPSVITEHCHIIQPNISIVTNVGLSHIGNFDGDIRKLAQAKSEIIHGMKQDGLLIINNDDENSKLLDLQSFKGKIITTGITKPAEYQAYDVSYSDNGMNFKMKLNNKEETFFIPILGEHHVYNAINAVAVADYLGFTPLEIKSGLLFKKPSRRMTIYKLKQSITLIDDTVHSHPQAVTAAVDVLTNISNERKIAILGQMRELGNLQMEQYKKIGEYVSNKGIDIVITYGYKADEIGKAAIASGMSAKNVKHFADKQKLHEFLQTILTKNDTILVKGASKTKMFDTVKFITTTIGEHK
ncbi:YheC/YheD family protein [Calidifontibacillus oryziterrae]|uniref:YheC/YheD family protein n=1 Tax=Calidifontibacillus oryziterrae TaxID=1191699 RepID=UPI0002F9B1D4|nr:YheC/YheD family protein [Calidifontibacillus oryziterrae]